MYVIDGPAIVSVPLAVADASKIYLSLTDLLDDGELCFPNEVVDELERTAKGEPPLVWARSCAANRRHKGAAYNFIEWVIQDYPDLVDSTARDTQEPGAVYVVAQALALRQSRLAVTVVTEDTRRKPTRASVVEACEHFGLRSIALVEFLAEAGVLVDVDDEDDELDELEG